MATMCDDFLDFAGLKRIYEAIMGFLGKKQDTLVSGQNIKTINGKSVLGSGNITVEGSGGSGGGGVSVSTEYIYTRTANEKAVPAKPDSVDEDEYVPADWTRYPQGITVEYQAEWVSVRTKSDDGWGAYSTPALWARYGQDGTDAATARTVMVYKAADTKPDTPTGGSWEVGTNTVTAPDGWYISPDAAKNANAEALYVWFSTATFKADGSIIGGTWSEPIRLTGANGSDGTDGTNIEFIYKLTATALETPSKPENVATKTGYVPTGWTDHPTGISETETVEWVCTRSKNASGEWDDWEGPAIWSKWGSDGKDGDGVEYIYKLTATAVQPDRPVATGSGDEDIPDGWTDDPTGVDATNQWEWVSQRKYTNGAWGAYSSPALWAKYGESGSSGLSVRVMYAKTSGSSEEPTFVEDDINPGSAWGSVIPEYSKPEAVWSIQATVTYDNKLEGTWQGPVLMTGIDGDATTPNYKTYVYKKSDSKPSKPTGSEMVPSGWSDYPTDGDGQWWQSIGSVNGTTGLVTSWSEVLAVNAEAGKDGAHVEFRFAVFASSYSSVSTPSAVRNPSGWSTTPPSVGSSQRLWMTTATIDGDDNLVGTWSTPVKISGETGAKGESITGETGATGIPGVTTELRYSLGSADAPDAGYGTANLKLRQPTGWSLSLPTPTAAKPYIWVIQSRINYSRTSAYVVDDPTVDGSGTLADGYWHGPSRLSGVNGVDGSAASKIVYPAGVYSTSESYTTDSDTMPYVLDSLDGNYYVLNKEMTWKGTEQDGKSPSQATGTWLKLDKFKAVYAQVAVVANGLIGSAVFNGDYMFSQRGIDASGNSVSSYQNFNSKDPYNSGNSFRPNWCVNLSTGEMWASAGKIHFSADGSGQLADGVVSWAKDGTTTIGDGIVVSPDLVYLKKAYFPVSNYLNTATTLVVPLPEVADGYGYTFCVTGALVSTQSVFSIKASEDTVYKYIPLRHYDSDGKSLVKEGTLSAGSTKTLLSGEVAVITARFTYVGKTYYYQNYKCWIIEMLE